MYNNLYTRDWRANERGTNLAFVWKKKRETSLFFSFAVFLLRMRGHELHFHFVHSEKWG